MFIHVYMHLHTLFVCLYKRICTEQTYKCNTDPVKKRKKKNAPIHSFPNMLKGWGVQWVCWPCPNWNVVSVQELCTDPWNMRWWLWMNATTTGLRIWSQYLYAFKPPTIKCSCACYPWQTPAHTIAPPLPWATSTTLTSAKHSPTRRDARCPPSSLCRQNWDSSVWGTPLQSAVEWERLPTQLGYGPDLDEEDEHEDELPWGGFWQCVQRFFGFANPMLPQLVPDHPGGEDVNVLNIQFTGNKQFWWI